MKRKARIVLLAGILLFVLALGIQSFIGNYRFGEHMRFAANQVRTKSEDLANGIAQLQKQYADANGDMSKVYSLDFENALSSIWSSFGGEGTPIMPEAKRKYTVRMSKLYSVSVYKNLVAAMLAEDQGDGELSVLRDDLYNLVDIMDDFLEDYDKTPQWKRYFISWESQRDALTQTVLDAL